MDIVVKEELKAYIDPLSDDEYAALERSILAEGCRDALVLWGDVLIDGHNRYSICEEHGLPFQTIQNTRFQSMEDVYLWMIDQHLGRRSVSDFQRGVLALRKREILHNRREQAVQSQVAPMPSAAPEPPATGAGTEDSTPPWEGQGSEVTRLQSDAPTPKTEAETLNSREALAKAARLSSSQVVMIERIQQQAAPEVVAALKAGEISLSAAATVAMLPEGEQKAAAMAGKDELKQAAKRVREAKRKPRAAPADTAEEQSEQADAELHALRQRVLELTQENEALKRELAQLRGEVE